MSVLSIEDLAEIKKTRRLGDYDVITALARIRPEGLDWIRSRFPETPLPNATHRDLALRLAKLQKSDARYWHPILVEIRRMWQNDRLMPEGERVG